MARATPFLPGISGGIWSTGYSSSPHMSSSLISGTRGIDDVSRSPARVSADLQKDSQIRQLQERLDNLQIEKNMALADNCRLSSEVQHLTSLVQPPSLLQLTSAH